MALQPEFNMSLHWLERHPNQLLTGLLKCCDSFSSEVLRLRTLPVAHPLFAVSTSFSCLNWVSPRRSLLKSWQLSIRIL